MKIFYRFCTFLYSICFLPMKSYLYLFFLLFSGKNLYNNEHVAIKLVSSHLIFFVYFVKYIKFASLSLNRTSHNYDKCVCILYLGKDDCKNFRNDGRGKLSNC